MRLWLGIPLVVVAVGATAWVSEYLGGSPPAKLAASVLAGLLATFAETVVTWLIRRRRERRRAAKVAERAGLATPATLLRADQQVVPFSGRQREQAELREWCRDDKPPVRLLVGPGGVGKTRLAIELGEYLRSCGWRFVMVAWDKEGEALDLLRATTRGSLFLVVDYAETRANLDRLLRSVPDHSAHVRILLIARGVGDWWRRLGAAEPAVRALVNAYPPMELSGERGERHGRAELARAVPYFASALGLPAPRRVDLVVQGEVPLLVLHAAALVAVLRGRPFGQLASDERLVADVGVLRELVDHEKRYWMNSAGRAGIIGLDSVVLGRAVAVACLLPAANEAEAARLLRRVPDLAFDEGRRRQVARWLSQLYPVSEGFWGALQPELVAETHVLDVLGDCPELVTTDLAELRDEQARQLLTMLSLAAAHRPEQRGLLEQVLRRELGLLPVALRVAIASGGALRTVLVRVLATAPLTPDQLREIDRELPYPTTGLSGAAVVVARRVLRSLPPDTDPAEVARWRERLAVTEAQAGRPAAALRDIQLAVAGYRALVDTDRRRFLPDLARCLHLLGIQYAERGRHDLAVEHAREAARHFRALHDRADRYRADRAACLHNLGTWLVELGQSNEALPLLEEAVDIYRDLVEVDLDSYLGALTEATHNLDLCRAQHSAPEEPLSALWETVTHLRGLADTAPDHYLPDLARAQQHLGTRYLEDGEPGEALPNLREALVLYQKLAGENSRYRPDVAACLNNLGVTLFQLGRAEEAVELAQQAVGLNRALSRSSPRRHRAELARALDNLVLFLARLNRHAEAVEHAEEAVRLHRHLARLDPKRFRPELARALTNLGVSLSELGRPAEALPAAREAVAICRDLLAADPERHWAQLARALDNLAVDHTALRRHADADRCRQEAARLRQRYLEPDPPPRRWWEPWRRRNEEARGALPHA